MSAKGLLTAVGVAVGSLIGLSSVASADPFVLFPNAPSLSYTNGLAGADGSAPQVNQFVHPISAPYYHEDSFVTTDLRAWYAYHTFSPNSVLAGGEVQVLAAQVRLALTDDLQFVAYKDGWDHLHSGLIQGDGWNDIAAGLKLEFYRDWSKQTFLSAGVGYQFPFGESSVLQNKEDIRLWLAGDKGIGALHLGGTFNYFFADGAKGVGGASDTISAHLHADYYVCSWFSPVVELNYYHTLKNRGPLPIQGADFTDLGDGKADDIWTLAIGGEIRPTSNIGIRAAFERNMNKPTDIFDNRLTLSAVISF